jgi:hypothetical protein
VEERWRKKPGIRAVEHDPQNYVILDEGRRTLDARVTIDAETFERMREGRVCAKCYEPQGEAFPEICAMPGCGFPIRRSQLDQLEADYQGTQWLGPRQSLEDEILELEERRAKSKIVLPPGVRGS